MKYRFLFSSALILFTVMNDCINLGSEYQRPELGVEIPPSYQNDRTEPALHPVIEDRSQFLIPMAISLGFGVLFATFITLLLIPCGFMIREDILHLVGSIKA